MSQPQTRNVVNDVDRMRRAAERLERLLADAGPNIRVTKAGTAQPPDDAVAPGAEVDGRQPPTPTAAAAQPDPAARNPAGTAHPRPTRIRLASRAQTPDVSASEAARARADGIPGPIAQPPRAEPAPAAEPPPEPSFDLAARRPAPREAPLQTAPPPSPAALEDNAPSALDRLGRLVAGDTSAPAPVPETPPTDVAARPRFTGRSELANAIRDSKRAFLALGVFSLVINVMMLAGPLFMLQVYDRVMTSGSMPTLIALFAMTAAVYVVIGLLELVRSRVIVRVGVEIDGRVANRIFSASLKRSVASTGQPIAALRELDNLRQFLAGPGPSTFFDAPWTPVYLLVIFLMHWMLGVAATIGALVLVALTLASELRSRAPLLEAGRAAARSLELADTGQRNAEAITAMGMLDDYRTRWRQANAEALAWQIKASDRLGAMSAASRSLRLLMQSLMLAIGAALALDGAISAGTIVAATIIFGRALAPVEQAIGQWRQLLKARESYAKLDALLATVPVPPARTALPAPRGHLEVLSLKVAAPDTRQPILAGLDFQVEPGNMLAVIGPSASGKSTLARALVGLWPPYSGAVKLDGARLDQWSQEELGRHIGYLPQSVELFAGTVRENIARFHADATDEAVVAAARQAHAHDMILALPKGYDTELGAFGTYLSAGQRQRIALARALYGDPALVVLDEPNANLDRIGDEALTGAIAGMRQRGQAIVLISHRVQAIGIADQLLYMERGVQRAYGPRAEVMKLFQPSGPRRRASDFDPTEASDTRPRRSRASGPAAPSAADGGPR